MCDKIKLKDYKAFFIDEGNVLNHLELWNRDGKKYLGLSYPEDMSEYDNEYVYKTFLNVREDTEVPCLCIRLDIG